MTYTLIEKKDLESLRKGCPLAWPVSAQIYWDWPLSVKIISGAQDKFNEGILYDRLVRCDRSARLRCRNGDIVSINKLKLYRIQVPEIENIDAFYYVDE